MKKSLLMLTIALLGLMGMTASAQSKCKASEACPAQQAANKMRQPQAFTEFAFEGILLDMNQQQRIDSLNAAVKANAECQQPQCPNANGQCPNDSCRKAQCSKENDNCPNAECKGKNCADCKQCSGKGGKKGNPGMGQSRCPYGPEYVAKVKEILDPNQYVMFLENIVNMPADPKGACIGAPDKMMKHNGDAARKKMPRQKSDKKLK